MTEDHSPEELNYSLGEIKKLILEQEEKLEQSGELTASLYNSHSKRLSDIEVGSLRSLDKTVQTLGALYQLYENKSDDDWIKSKKRDYKNLEKLIDKFILRALKTSPR